MEPISSHSSQFVERWAHSEQINIKLGLILILMALVCAGLTIALVYAAVKPRPIYYIPGAWEAGTALPQSLPQTTVATFVSSWVLNWSNFTPATVQNIYTRAQRFMSPHLLSKNEGRLKKDIEDVKHNNMSSLFSVVEEPSVTPEKIGFRVTLQGEKGIYVGKEEIKTQRMIYRVLVRAIPPTDWNPYGLLIEEIDQEIIAP